MLSFLTIVLISSPSYSSGITSNANSATCNNSTLETYTGTSNLQANWSANTINITWYNDDTQFASNSCTYGGPLTMPNDIPTKTGYTFAGWRVRVLPTMDFSTIPTDENGTAYLSIGWYNNENYCMRGESQVSCDSDNTYSQELQTYEWKVEYSHGDLYGTSGCSTTSGTYPVAGNPTIGSGRYCWCKATGYKATGSSEVKGPLSALSWVFSYTLGSVAGCAQSCASGCARSAENYSAFRGALFAPAQ